MKTVFITGSGRRIGRGLALKFAELGWNAEDCIIFNLEMAERTHAEVLSFGVKSSIVRFDVKNYGPTFVSVCRSPLMKSKYRMC